WSSARQGRCSGRAWPERTGFEPRLDAVNERFHQERGRYVLIAHRVELETRRLADRPERQLVAAPCVRSEVVHHRDARAGSRQCASKLPRAHLDTRISRESMLLLPSVDQTALRR